MQNQYFAVSLLQTTVSTFLVKFIFATKENATALAA